MTEISKGERRRVARDEVVRDEELYPRIKMGWQTAYQYAQAMRAGAIFPPVVLGRIKRKPPLYLVDGWHRDRAYAIIKEEEFDAIVYTYANKNDLFVDAVKLNTSHGRQLSVQERVRIVDKLGSMRFSADKISEIIRIPIDKLEVFKARTFTRPNGTRVYLKSLAARAGATDMPDGSQDTFSVRNVDRLLVQILEVLRGDIFPVNDEGVKEHAVELYTLLGQVLELS